MTKVIQHPSLCRDCVPCLQIVLRGGMTTWKRDSGRVAISNELPGSYNLYSSTGCTGMESTGKPGLLRSAAFGNPPNPVIKLCDQHP